jgi:hypothetical protein
MTHYITHTLYYLYALWWQHERRSCSSLEIASFTCGFVVFSAKIAGLQARKLGKNGWNFLLFAT